MPGCALEEEPWQILAGQREEPDMLGWGGPYLDMRSLEGGAAGRAWQNHGEQFLKRLPGGAAAEGMIKYSRTLNFM